VHTFDLDHMKEFVKFLRDFDRQRLICFEHLMTEEHIRIYHKRITMTENEMIEVLEKPQIKFIDMPTESRYELLCEVWQNLECNKCKRGDTSISCEDMFEISFLSGLRQF
jgi:hypothetical protein